LVTFPGCEFLCDRIKMGIHNITKVPLNMDKIIKDTKTMVKIKNESEDFV